LKIKKVAKSFKSFDIALPVRPKRWSYAYDDFFAMLKPFTKIFFQNSVAE